MRPMLGAFRIRLNVPTQHPEQRPATLPLATRAASDSHDEVTQIPASEHPSGAGFPIYPPPTVLEGREPDDTYELKAKLIIPGLSTLTAAQKRFAGKAIKIADIAPTLFARMMAKCAHAVCFGEFRGFPPGFRPLLPEVILGKSDTFLHVVGCLPDIPEPQPAVPHTVRMHDIRVGEKTYICADIRLFAFLATPVYRVVCAEGTTA